MRTMYSSLNQSSAASLVLRLVIGGLFIWHGVDKFDAGLEMVEGGFRMWGVPLPAFTSRFTAITEVIAGAALILGLLTRLSAFVLAVILVGALIWAKDVLTDTGTGIISSRMEPVPGYELDLAYLAGLVALVFMGPGRWSVDHAVGIDRVDDDRRATRQVATEAA